MKLCSGEWWKNSQVGWCWIPATTEPRIQGDVQPREPGDMDRHQNRCHLSVSGFSEAFSTFDQTCLRKQHKELQKSPSSEPQWIYHQHLLFCMSSAFLMWIMDSNGSRRKASQRGPEQAEVYQQKYLRKVLPLEAGAWMKEVTVWMQELKNSQSLFLDEKKSRGKSLSTWELVAIT